MIFDSGDLYLPQYTRGEDFAIKLKMDIRLFCKPLIPVENTEDMVKDPEEGTVEDSEEDTVEDSDLEDTQQVEEQGSEP